MTTFDKLKKALVYEIEMHKEVNYSSQEDIEIYQRIIYGTYSTIHNLCNWNVIDEDEHKELLSIVSEYSIMMIGKEFEYAKSKLEE